MCREQPLVNKPFPTLILQLYVLADLSSFKEGKIFPFDAKFNEINIYFPHNLRQTVNVVSTCK